MHINEVSDKETQIKGNASYNIEMTNQPLGMDVDEQDTNKEVEVRTMKNMLSHKISVLK